MMTMMMRVDGWRLTMPTLWRALAVQRRQPRLVCALQLGERREVDVESQIDALWCAALPR